MESNRLLPPFQFSCIRSLETCDALLTLSHLQQIAGQRHRGKAFQLDVSAASGRISHCSLLHKLRSIGVEGQFLYIVLEFLSDRKQCVRFDSKVSVSVDAVLGVPQGNVLEPLLIMLYTDFFHIIGNNIIDCVDNTMI